MTVENVIESEVMPLRRGTSGYRTVTVALFAAGLSTFISMYAAQALLPAFAEDFHVLACGVCALRLGDDGHVGVGNHSGQCALRALRVARG